MFRYQQLNDTLYFWFGLNTTDGAGGDGTSPLFDVRLAGAAASAAPVLSGTPDLLTHASYPDGCYEIAIAATSGNGFAAGSQYAVFCSATISSVNPTGFIGGFVLSPVVANTMQLAGQTVTAAAGVTFPTSVASPTNITAATGIVLSGVTHTGAVIPTVTTTTNLTNAPTNGDFTATMKASITTAVPTVAGIADGVWDEVVTAATHNVAESAALRLRLSNSLTTVAGSVNDAGATSTSFVTNLPSNVDDFYKDSLLVFTDSPGASLVGQVRPITSYNGTTKAVTFDEAFTSAPNNGDAFSIVSIHVHPISQIQAGLATAANLAIVDGIVDSILLDTAEIGTAGAGLTNVPWNASWDAQVESEVTDALNAYDPPTNTELTARTLASADYATSTALGVVDGIVDTILVTTNKVDDTLEDDAGTYRFTANALEQAPSGGGGGTTDWTADERTVIRAVLGIPGSGTTPADPSTGILDTIRDLALDIPTNSELTTALADLPTNAELATALGTADDAVLSAISALNDLDATEVQTAAAAAITAASLATAASVADLPTNAELATALGTADDAVLAAIADLPTNAELATALGTADDAILVQVALVKAKTDLIPVSPAAVGDIPTANAIATATLDLADGIEVGLTLRQAQRLQTAALAGEVSGAETTEVTIRNAVADSKNRIVATVDANGNRTSVVTDLS